MFDQGVTSVKPCKNVSFWMLVAHTPCSFCTQTRKAHVEKHVVKKKPAGEGQNYNPVSASTAAAALVFRAPSRDDLEEDNLKLQRVGETRTRSGARV